MEVKKVVLGAHPQPLKRKIPDCAEKDRTIYLSQMGVLFLFKDHRPQVYAWVEDVLPSLVLGISKDKIMKIYGELEEGQWLEFDYGLRTLSLCSLLKKESL